MATRDIVGPSRTTATAAGTWSRAGGRRRALPVVVWVVAGQLYTRLGALQPWLLLLGFWQAVPAVLGITLLVRRVSGRRRP